MRSQRFSYRFAVIAAPVFVFLMLLFAPYSAMGQVSENQTDWSGGPGEIAPVVSWQNRFEASTNISYQSIGGQLALSSVPRALAVQRIIAGDAGMPHAVAVGDLNGDGRADVVNTDAVYNVPKKKGAIYWWEQRDGSNWLPHVVDRDFYGAFHVNVADVDGDGDNDVIASAHYGVADPAPPPPPDRNGRFAWFENVNGDGTAWIQHVVGEMFWGARYVDAGDFDGDGDTDIVGASELTNGVYEQDADVVWFENLNGVGTAWLQHDLDDDFPNAAEARAVDINGDGSIDIVAARSDEIAWYENTNDDGSVWTKHVVSTDIRGKGFVDFGDVDKDGDMDLVGGGFNSSIIFWWENLNGDGTLWQEVPIGGASHCWTIDVADLDGDGDSDGLICRTDVGYGGVQAFWAENISGDGASWAFNIVKYDEIAGDLDGPSWVVSGDANNDGKLDAVFSTNDPDNNKIEQISWLDMTEFLPAGELTSSVLDAGDTPTWERLVWDASVTAGTELTVQVRASNDPGELGSYVVVPASGTDIGALIDPHARFFQYRLLFSSTDPAASPVIREIGFESDAPVELILSAPSPGIAGQTNTIAAAWPFEGEMVYFAYSLGLGATPIPTCPGEFSDLNKPQLLGIAAVDANGEATIEFSVPQAAKGLNVHFQALQNDSCTLSNLAQQTFE